LKQQQQKQQQQQQQEEDISNTDAFTAASVRALKHALDKTATSNTAENSAQTVAEDFVQNPRWSCASFNTATNSPLTIPHFIRLFHLYRQQILRDVQR
jgi:hypothetical protein